MTTLITRPEKKSMRTSMIVPCSHKHVHILQELFDHLNRQSRKPDEIIVSVSGCAAPEGLPSNVRVIHSPTPLPAGTNRNRASEAATGDVFIYQDADDLPHPQRIEIIAGLFEGFEVEHLMHYYFHKESKPCTFTSAEAVAQSTYFPKYSRSNKLTNGNVAIANFVFRTVKWPEWKHRGQDVEFNGNVYKHFIRTVVAPFPLLTYRQDLSSWNRK